MKNDFEKAISILAWIAGILLAAVLIAQTALAQPTPDFDPIPARIGVFDAAEYRIVVRDMSGRIIAEHVIIGYVAFQKYGKVSVSLNKNGSDVATTSMEVSEGDTVSLNWMQFLAPMNAVIYNLQKAAGIRR